MLKRIKNYLRRRFGIVIFRMRVSPHEKQIARAAYKRWHMFGGGFTRQETAALDKCEALKIPEYCDTLM
jgi:hypothetical protein